MTISLDAELKLELEVSVVITPCQTVGAGITEESQLVLRLHG